MGSSTADGGTDGRGGAGGFGTAQFGTTKVPKAVGGRLLSVTNAVEAGVWRQGHGGWAWAGRREGECIPGHGGRGAGGASPNVPQALVPRPHPRWPPKTDGTRGATPNGKPNDRRMARDPTGPIDRCAACRGRRRAPHFTGAGGPLGESRRPTSPVPFPRNGLLQRIGPLPKLVNRSVSKTRSIPGPRAVAVACAARPWGAACAPCGHRTTSAHRL